MPEAFQRRMFILMVIFAAVLAAMAVVTGFGSENIWAAPLVLIFFFLAYQFDVKVPTLGSLNVDHVIAFPAVMLLRNPLLTGLLAALGLLVSRAIRLGPRKIKPINGYDAVQVALAISAGGWVLLHLSRDLETVSLLWLPYLALAMAVTVIFNVGAYILGRAVTRRPVPAPVFRKSLLQNFLWIGISLPFVMLVVNEILDRNALQMVLAGVVLLIIVWALRLNATLEEKNAALIYATGRQEFLQQLTLTSTGSLENESFLGDLLRGLKQYVGWDKELLLVLPTPNIEDPMLFSLEDLPPDAHGVKDTLMGFLEGTELRQPRVTSGQAVKPLLTTEAQSQVVIALATSQVAFGILVLERTSPKAFGEPEVRFLDIAFSQIAQHVQDEILKKQLLITNRKLLQQTDFLSQILQISNLLRVHLDVQAILEKVAQGIREGIGFRGVLISLYHEEEGYFERVAQGGLDDRWEEIMKVRPPADEILAVMKDQYRVSNCFFVRHTDQPEVRPYDVLPLNPKMPQDPDDWDPMDILIVPLWDKDNRLLGIISVDEPVDGKIPSMETFRALEILANQTVHALESAQVHARIKRQAVIDGLTGLYNHAYFQETMAARAREHAEVRLPYTLLMMDVDNFKNVNDTYGHLAGDAVLRAVAEALTASIRKEDVAARYGGEEFAIFLPGRTAEESLAIAERIRTAVEAIRVHLSGSGKPIRVTISVGMASSPQHGLEHPQILDQADAALYRAKRSGKNQVSVAAQAQ